MARAGSESTVQNAPPCTATFRLVIHAKGSISLVREAFADQEITLASLAAAVLDETTRPSSDRKAIARILDVISIED